MVESCDSCAACRWNAFPQHLGPVPTRTAESKLTVTNSMVAHGSEESASTLFAEFHSHQELASSSLVRPWNLPHWRATNPKT